MDADLNRQGFLASIDRLQGWLAADGIPFAIIGSLGVAAYTDQGQRLDFSREHAHDPCQRVPDVDLLVPRAALHAVQAYAVAARRQQPVPVKIDTFATECYIDFRPGEYSSYLTHRSLRFPVRTALFEPRDVTLLGHRLRTIDPRVLLHTFGTVGGVIRKKDVPKIVSLAAAIKSGQAVSGFSERDCEVFSRYRAVRQRRYPMFIAAKGAWQRTLEALPPTASQALRNRLIPPAQHTMGALSRSPVPDPAPQDEPRSRGWQLRLRRSREADKSPEAEP